MISGKPEAMACSYNVSLETWLKHTMAPCIFSIVSLQIFGYCSVYFVLYPTTVTSSGLEEQGTQWITFLLSCFATWSDVSSKFCDVILRSGLLYTHIRAVNALRRDMKSVVCISMEHVIIGYKHSD